MLSLFYVRLFCALCIVAPALTGCAPNASLIPKSDRAILATRAVEDAVSAYNRGDTQAGDTVLSRAVTLLTDSATGAFSDTGYIAVAERLNEQGRPQDALRLLDPLTKDRRVSSNPLLWATVARSAKLASDTRRENDANTRAREAANAIVAGFDGIVGQKEKLAAAERAGNTARYFDEYAADYPKALQAFREAYRLSPDPATGSRLGYALANRGSSPADFADAVRLTRDAVEKRPDEPVFLDAFGWALFKRGDAKLNDLAGARRRLREAADLAPDSFAIHTHLATVYEATNELPDALRESRIAAQLAPENGAAKEKHDRLKALVASLPSPAPSPSPTGAGQSRPPEP
ncbi:MAG: hypothetical protein H7Y38_19575 [Armatimonadetes bacterium]|nr:hypothetical protein [Armatimonadota bacterium]